jgi:hypothetical protein
MLFSPLLLGGGLLTADYFDAATGPTSQIISPSLFTNSSDFYGATVNQASPGQSLTPTRIDNAQTFFAPAVTCGAVTLTPARFDNAAAFYAPTVSQGAAPAQSLVAARFDNTAQFFAAVVASGSAPLQSLAPDLLASVNAFYAPTVGRGAVSLSAPLVASASVFYAPTVSLASGAQQLEPSLLGNESVFFSPVVSGGEAEAPRLGGFVFTDTAPRMWWKRKPRYMPDDEAEELVKDAADELARVAARQVRVIKPGQPLTKEAKIEARDAVAPLVADMPGFDWVALYRRILDALQLQAMEQAAQQMAAQEIERIRLMELDEEDVLILLMGT